MINPNFFFFSCCAVLCCASQTDSPTEYVNIHARDATVTEGVGESASGEWPEVRVENYILFTRECLFLFLFSSHMFCTPMPTPMYDTLVSLFAASLMYICGESYSRGHRTGSSPRGPPASLELLISTPENIQTRSLTCSCILRPSFLLLALGVCVKYIVSYKYT